MNIAKVNFNSPSFGYVTRLAARNAMDSYGTVNYDRILDAVKKESENPHYVVYYGPRLTWSKSGNNCPILDMAYYHVSNAQSGVNCGDYYDFFEACARSQELHKGRLVMPENQNPKAAEEEILSYCK